jgi:hypothetical protein
MQARQPTYLESLLNRLTEPCTKLLGENEGAAPLAVLTGYVLRDDDSSLPPVPEILVNDQMLKAGRAYLALLLDNDRLPRGEQLTLEELTLPRGLLLQFFQGHSDIQARAQEVLGLVERKFSQRSFQQATILLQLFETDHTTKLQNERKLFYEDMIQRLGIRRRYPLSKVEVEQVKDHFQEMGVSLDATDLLEETEAGERAASEAALSLTPWVSGVLPPVEDDDEAVSKSSDTEQASSTLEIDGETIEKALAQDPPPLGDADGLVALVRSCDWLAARHQISFSLLSRHPEEYIKWRRLVHASSEEHQEEFVRFVPPKRWRSPADFADLPLFELVAAYLTPDTFKEYLETMTRACYFLLLAVGDTGLEGFLDTYFDWLSRRFGLDGTVFIDRLHRQSTFGEQTLSETLSSIYDEHFIAPIEAGAVTFSENMLRTGIRKFIDQMATTNFAEVAPGHYNLGGMILDQIFEIEYPTVEFPFKIHRIV